MSQKPNSFATLCCWNNKFRNPQSCCVQWLRWSNNRLTSWLGVKSLMSWPLSSTNWPSFIQNSNLDARLYNRPYLNLSKNKYHPSKFWVFTLLRNKNFIWFWTVFSERWVAQLRFTTFGLCSDRCSMLLNSCISRLPRSKFCAIEVATFHKRSLRNFVKLPVRLYKIWAFCPHLQLNPQQKASQKTLSTK